MVLWQMFNGALFQLGWWTSHKQAGIVVERVTVLHAEWWWHGNNDGMFDLVGPVQGGGTYNVTNITWRDVRVEAPVAGPQGGSMIRVDLASARGAIQNWRLENVAVHVMPRAGSLDTAAPEQELLGISIANLTIGAQCIHNALAAGLVADVSPKGRPSNVSFICGRSRGWDPPPGRRLKRSF